MKTTLFRKLFILFLTGSALFIFLFSFLTFQLTENQFDHYLSDRFVQSRETLVGQLEESYVEYGEWNTDALAGINWTGMQSQIMFTVVTPSGEEIVPEVGMMSDGRRMMHGNGSAMLETDGDILTETIDLYADDVPIGTAQLQYPGVPDYSDHEQQFISDLLGMLAIIAVISIIAAAVAAYLLSKRLSKPIIETSDLTEAIADGDYSRRLEHPEPIEELNKLQTNVNTLADQLAMQQTMRNQLVSDLAHEVRTPLTTLQGNIEAMMDGVWPMTTERLALIELEVNRLSQLIEKIDHIDDVQYQQNELKLETFDLTKRVGQIATIYEQRAMEKKIGLTVVGDPLRIEADISQISQVITNLITNAIKFTPEKGKITVDVKEADGFCHLLVSDTGKGISKENQQQIFNRFYQVEPSRNTKIEGQGLGLAVVKSIIDAHHGKIRVESDEGKGSVFAVILPIKQ
ncbi:cell wall metabolism sensor histidine kinase WalK [Alkalibacterium sp. 20]|uniref:sensor histidine kinase n=1 Tax=Alkalibacterium sp. 20 TaxID=1798803 RepID=UPI0009002AF9|nr:HAMP domain-containing sensor histidine kinase [Alkalibacterium sp. 20]OJF90174.1 hypothetical protein AX762_04690 [Alkalibacterium sp. 20]